MDAETYDSRVKSRDPTRSNDLQKFELVVQIIGANLGIFQLKLKLFFEESRKKPPFSLSFWGMADNKGTATFKIYWTS